LSSEIGIPQYIQTPRISPVEPVLFWLDLKAIGRRIREIRGFDLTHADFGKILGNRASTDRSMRKARTRWLWNCSFGSRRTRARASNGSWPGKKREEES